MAQGQIVRSQANVFLEQLFWTASSGGKAYHYIGLSTTAPDENGGNVTEPSKAAGYSRKQLNMMGAASDGQIENLEIIFMGESLGDGWGTVTHFFISKTVSDSPIFHAPLNASVQIPGGYVPIFRAGALVVGLDKDSLDVAA